MTRILLIETASPKRVREKAERILKSGDYPEPEVTILCSEKNSHEYGKLHGITLYTAAEHSWNRSAKGFIRDPFDVAFAFWTGEQRYRRQKLWGIRPRANETYILSGDGNEFRLTWKAVCRHALFRLRHPLPTDHRDYIEGSHEEVLVIQSAEPAYVLRALDRLAEQPLFIHPRFTVFCRNRPEVVGSFRENPRLHEVLVHLEARHSWKHLRFLRRRRFDAIVLFLTGDPSYWKVKLFAFLLGTRRILIFNEANDCFFFTLHQWLALISHRLRVRPHPESRSNWGRSTRILVSLVLKSAILPFRFLWLLLVWIRLRFAGLISSGKSHDYPL